MVTLLIVIVTVAVSYQAMNNFAFRERFIFRIANVRAGEWYRLFTSGFIHLSWMQVFWNMLSLFFVGRVLEFSYQGYASPILAYLGLYFGSMAAGNGVAYLIRRNDAMYTAIGSFGAISGLLFALVTANPNIPFFFFIPGWIFAAIFVFGSIYTFSRRPGAAMSVESNLGGALFGMLLAVAIQPSLVLTNWWLLLLLGVPTGVFLYLAATNPLFLMDPGKAFSSGNTFSRPARTRQRSRPGPRVVHVRQSDRKSPNIPTRSELQEELDQLLEKVGKKGVEGLSKKDRNRLDELSQMLDGSQASDR
ncbi:MAG: rhomboid family intramembrane serine protease [Bacteroidota bacterium]